MEAPLEYVHVARTFYARSGTDLHAQSALIDKKFCIGTQSEVDQECVVVGWGEREGDKHTETKTEGEREREEN